MNDQPISCTVTNDKLLNKDSHLTHVTSVPISGAESDTCLDVTYRRHGTEGGVVLKEVVVVMIVF